MEGRRTLFTALTEVEYTYS